MLLAVQAVLGIVAPLHIHVRMYHTEHFARLRLVEHGHCADAFQGVKQVRPVLLAYNRTLWPLEYPHRGIAVHCHQKAIRRGCSGGQVFHMPTMQQIKCAVCDSQFLAASLQFPRPFSRFLQSHYSHYYSPLFCFFLALRFF